MKKIFLLIIILLLASCCTHPNSIEVAFWNVENLFDLEDDPIKNDDEFALGGRKMVTQEILDMKLDHLTEVLIDLDVDILGLCEVENMKVIQMLNNRYTQRDYSIIHYEGPDLRGIDVALMYDPEKFEVSSSEPINIPFGEESPTRDILHVEGKFMDQTLHLFVNHWPSNYSGLERGMVRRKVGAAVLREKIDEILLKDKNANIVLMGDFNEDPVAEAVKDVLISSINKGGINNGNNVLWNPMSHLMGVENGGTYKYRGVDNVIDQFMVSGALVDGRQLELKPKSVKVLKDPKYRQTDGDYRGYPFRFWVGDNLLGGYSDHMAIQCELVLKKD